MGNKKFCLTITKKEIAKQIAALLNIGGQLGYYIRTEYVLNNDVKYCIELNQNRVIGVAGIEKKTDDVSEIKHICVHPNYRNKNIGKKLLKQIIELSETNIVYEIIRKDNHVNIHNSLKLHFIPVAVCNGIVKQLIIFARKKR